MAKRTTYWDTPKVQLSGHCLASLGLARSHILLLPTLQSVHCSGEPTITMGIQRESQVLRRNSEKASKVSSFSALGAVNGFSWAEGSLWNSTANLRNQCVSTYTVMYVTWRLTASSQGNAWARASGKVTLSADLEKMQEASTKETLSLATSGFELLTPSPKTHDYRYFSKHTILFAVSHLCLHICYSLPGKPSMDLWQSNEFHIYT